jgi:hypothetical protein
MLSVAQGVLGAVMEPRFALPWCGEHNAIGHERSDCPRACAKKVIEACMPYVNGRNDLAPWAEGICPQNALVFGKLMTHVLRAELTQKKRQQLRKEALLAAVGGRAPRRRSRSPGGDLSDDEGQHQSPAAADPYQDQVDADKRERLERQVKMSKRDVKDIEGAIGVCIRNEPRVPKFICEALESLDGILTQVNCRPPATFLPALACLYLPDFERMFQIMQKPVTTLRAFASPAFPRELAVQLALASLLDEDTFAYLSKHVANARLSLAELVERRTPAANTFWHANSDALAVDSMSDTLASVEKAINRLRHEITSMVNGLLSWQTHAKSFILPKPDGTLMSQVEGTSTSRLNPLPSSSQLASQSHSFRHEPAAAEEQHHGAGVRGGYSATATHEELARDAADLLAQMNALVDDAADDQESSSPVAEPRTMLHEAFAGEAAARSSSDADAADPANGARALKTHRTERHIAPIGDAPAVSN